jgi:polar amino acid transport system substrate-binding protein
VARFRNQKMGLPYNIDVEFGGILMRNFVFAAIAVFMATVPWMATSDAQTLAAIQSRGKVLIGIDGSNPPYGMMDQNMQITGIDVGVAKMIARDLGVSLEIVPVTGPNRVPFLLAKKVDLVVATFAVTPERARSVSFTIPYGSDDQVVVGKKDVVVKSAADLGGKTIGVVRGGLADVALTPLLPATTTIRRYEDDALNVAAFLAGQVDFIGNSASLLQPIIDKDAAHLEQKFLARRSPYSIGMRSDDPEFLHLINTFIYCYRLDGSLDQLDAKFGVAKQGDLPSF